MNSPSGAVFEVETARQTCLVFNCTAKQSKEIVWKAFRLNWGMNFEAKKYKALGILKILIDFDFRLVELTFL